MAVVVQKTRSVTGRVALATAWSHQRKANLVIETSLGSLVDDGGVDAVEAIVVVELDVVEIVVDDNAPWGALDKAIRMLADDFSKIVVLTPSPSMGTAHRELRGAPAVLQQWWLEGATVRFGVEETL